MGLNIKLPKLKNPLSGSGGKSGGKPKNPASHPRKLSPEEQKVAVRTGMKARAFITSPLDKNSKKRLILAEQEISLDKDWFYSKQVGKSYGIQADWVLLYGAKTSIVVYDVDSFEALSDQTAFGDLAPHWSARADQILRLGFVKQTVGGGAAAVGLGTGGITDWALKVGLGLLIGYLLGSSGGLNSLLGGSTTTVATNTHT